MVNASETTKPIRLSTGRGGAGNFKRSDKLAKKTGDSIGGNGFTRAINSQQHLDAETEADLALTRIATQASLGARFATGRGGAGNILPTGQAPLPAQTEPLIARSRPIVVTGRGSTLR